MAEGLRALIEREVEELRARANFAAIGGAQDDPAPRAFREAADRLETALASEQQGTDEAEALVETRVWKDREIVVEFLTRPYTTRQQIAKRLLGSHGLTLTLDGGAIAFFTEIRKRKLRDELIAELDPQTSERKRAINQSLSSSSPDERGGGEGGA